MSELTWLWLLTEIDLCLTPKRLLFNRHINWCGCCQPIGANHAMCFIHFLVALYKGPRELGLGELFCRMPLCYVKLIPSTLQGWLNTRKDKRVLRSINNSREKKSTAINACIPHIHLNFCPNPSFTTFKWLRLLHHHITPRDPHLLKHKINVD